MIIDSLLSQPLNCLWPVLLVPSGAQEDLDPGLLEDIAQAHH